MNYLFIDSKTESTLSLGTAVRLAGDESIPLWSSFHMVLQVGQL